MSFPPEVLLEILAHLPSADLMRSACVCHDWHDLIPAAAGGAPISAWKRRAQLYFPEWLEILPETRDCRWLCRCCDHVVEQQQRSYSGLGKRVSLGHGGEVETEYVGEFVNGEFEGVGMLRSHDDYFDFYAGTWKVGLEDGVGKFSWKGKAFYVGECSQGQRNGFGKYQWDENRKYVGFHKNNQLHGAGVFTYKDSLVIDGEWKADKKHGVCTIQWPPDQPSWKFIGRYESGHRVGPGSYFWSDGAVYTGEWQGANRHGPGRMEFSNGLVWEGTFVEDVRHGPGTLTWTDNGDTFQGTWYQGGRQGQGTFTEAATGKITLQFWNEPINAQYSTEGAPRWPPM